MLFIELHDQIVGKEQATKLLEEIEGHSAFRDSVHRLIRTGLNPVLTS